LIAGGGLWERVRSLDSLQVDSLDPLIFACARTKLAVVAADERDAGLRNVLNLGHTVGHAIEVATGYGRYRHGEAVGLGLLAALELSGAPDLRAEVEGILGRFALPTRLDPAILADQVVAATSRDKKVTADGLGFVMCSAPGRVVPDQRVAPLALRNSILRLQP
jgi:shikimate kinase/3-dehydroquinate synthase